MIVNIEGNASDIVITSFKPTDSLARILHDRIILIRTILRKQIVIFVIILELSTYRLLSTYHDIL